MAKLPRKTQKIFCSKPTSENQTSVFGTMKTADKQYSTDVGTLQSNAAYEQGWKSATIASYKPFMEDFNTLNYINTSQLAYLFQQGIPEWDESTAYYKNSFCSYNGDLWKSLIDDNLNNTPLEGESWTLFTSGKKSGGGLELCDIGMALYVDETKGLRRYLNGQIVDINTNTQAFLNRLLKIQTTNSDYFTTEENWQAEKTMNIDGCVYKFVLNYDSTGTNVISVRLPKYPDYIEINNNSINNTAPVAVYGNGMAIGTNYGNLWLADRGGSEGISLCYNAGQPDAGLGASSWSSGKYQFLGFNTNPSLSGLTGTATITSNFRKTKLKLRYFIQIATGSETENNIINEIELNNPYSLFDSKYSDHELNNLSWLKSEGQWNAKAVYTDAYDKLLKVYNGTETVAGLSVKLSTETYTDYDFVLNTTDETFRLPLKTNLASGKAVVGNGKALGVNVLDSSPRQILQGANYNTYVTTSPAITTTGNPISVSTDPTKSGIETSDSNLYLYYYVGETVQNANLIDAGRIGELVATKTNMLQASGAGMPSSKYIDLTLGASGSTYTAPANGWFHFAKKASANGQYVYFGEISIPYGLSGGDSKILLPCKKGDKKSLFYNLGGTTSAFRFYYAVGTESEAL